MKYIFVSFICFSLTLIFVIKKTFAQDINTNNIEMPYYIDSKGILYINISNSSEGIIAAQIDLHKFFPESDTIHLNGKHYQFNKDKIEIISYQSPPVLIQFSIDFENKKIQSASYSINSTTKDTIKLFSLTIPSKPLSFEALKKIEEKFISESIDSLSKEFNSNKYMINAFIFHAKANHFSNMDEFMQNLTQNLIKNNDKNFYEKVKILYFHYLIDSPQFNDINLAMTAIEYNDLSFLKKMRFNKINDLTIDEVSSNTYYFTMCSPLGKAIRQNKYQIAELLLKKGAERDKVCAYSPTEQYSALEIAEQYKNKAMIKLIHSYSDR